MSAGKCFIFIYLSLALFPGIASFFTTDSRESCQKYQNSLIVGSSFLVIQLPFWHNLPSLLLVPFNHLRARTLATASFTAEIPYIFAGLIISVNGMDLYNLVDPIAVDCTPWVLNFSMLFALMITTLLICCLWMLSISSFVQIVLVQFRKRLKFVAIVASVTALIIIASAMVAVFLNDLQNCEEPLLMWTMVSIPVLIIFFSAFYYMVSLPGNYLSHKQLMIISMILAFVLFPFINYWFIRGLDWVSTAENSGQLQEKRGFYMLILIHEVAVCYSFFCTLMMSFPIITRRVYSPNIFRPDLQMEFTLDFEIPVNPQQQERNVELAERLNSEYFKPEAHTESFKEKAVCPICWDKFLPEHKVIYLDGCSHIFHRNCIKEWVLKNPTCPSCRRVITGNREINIQEPLLNNQV